MLLKLERCGFREPGLLFSQTEDAITRILIALFVFLIQGVFENVAFWGTLCISATVQVIKKVKSGLNRHFYVDCSGVVGFISEQIFFEL